MLLFIKNNTTLICKLFYLHSDSHQLRSHTRTHQVGCTTPACITPPADSRKKWMHATVERPVVMSIINYNYNGNYCSVVLSCLNVCICHIMYQTLFGAIFTNSYKAFWSNFDKNIGYNVDIDNTFNSILIYSISPHL